MRFTGTLDELKTKLEPLNGKGKWVELNHNQIQFRHDNGGIMNWYPTTGTINFQGKGDCQTEVEKLLRVEENTNIASPTIKKTIAEANVGDSISKAKMEDSQRKIKEINDQIDNYSDSELVIGFVGAVGTEMEAVTRLITERLKAFEYNDVHEIRISKDVISVLRSGKISNSNDNYTRINELMMEGNELRKITGDNSVLALAAAKKINEIRTARSSSIPLKRTAFIINSLKHPEEVQRLRKIYANGFFLIGVYADRQRRYDYLTKNKGILEQKAEELIARDTDETNTYGQHTRDTFHLSDFFVNYDGNHDKFQNDIWRILDLIFGKPFVTPTFDEFAMFMAFSASLRSADLSRQVGAVMTKDDSIVSTGANDIPKAGGGLYWPKYNPENKEIIDKEDGRDYKRGFDSNAMEKKVIIDEIFQNIPDEIIKLMSPLEKEKFYDYLKKSRIKDITEYGRVVHAEMEAILACSRNSISTKDAELYCTTFPCHNCAKHIIAAGIKRVIYVEPYPKSKAFEFHSDSISISSPNSKNENGNVLFEPFVGVGPRSFFNLFSMHFGSGYQIKRKKADGEIIEWKPDTSPLRMQMLPSSYIERETLAVDLIKEYFSK